MQFENTANTPPAEQCIECHGSLVIPQDDVTLAGWPNAGVAGVDPNGSLGAYTTCHTRHKFSSEDARKPETCGQCHLGPEARANSWKNEHLLTTCLGWPQAAVPFFCAAFQALSPGLGDLIPEFSKNPCPPQPACCIMLGFGVKRESRLLGRG